MVQATKQKARVRQPITLNLLHSMREAWLEKGEASWDNWMLWAAASLCFFGFLRSGEITTPSDSSFDSSCHLSHGDVTVDELDNPSMLRVHLKASKTDPFRTGVDVFVGKTGGPLCPVGAMLKYLVARGCRPGPLDGRLLTRSRFVEQVRWALTTAGVDSTPYSGHSFRSGAATTAASQGIGDATIKMLGRWRSSAYQLYVKTPRSELAAFSRRLAGT